LCSFRFVRAVVPWTLKTSLPLPSSMLSVSTL